MIHTVKAVNVVPAVRCKDLFAPNTEFDTCYERHPAVACDVSEQNSRLNHVLQWHSPVPADASCDDRYLLSAC